MSDKEKDITEVTPELSEEEIKERESLLDSALEHIKEYGLVWNFRSINYVVKQNKVTFNQLRSCVFKDNGEVKRDLFEALRLIIEAGLVGSGKIDKTKKDELEEEAYRIIEDWREHFGYIGVLHIILINIMEKDHFFMGTQDLKVLELMSYQNMQKDLSNIAIASDIETRINQSRAVQ